MVKEFKALVEKTYTILIIAGFCVILQISIAVSSEIQNIYPNFDVRFWMPFMTLILIIFAGWLMDKFLKFEEILTATFYEDHIVLQRGKRNRVIPYHKIKKVVKYMIINRMYTDKGKYRVVIRCKGRNYVMYSGEDSQLKLDFEQTEISKIYYEFKNRGIMCC